MPVEDNMKTVRLFEISTQKEFLDEVFIDGALKKIPAIEKWAYILHDKDIYEVGHKQAGEPKPPHWHVFVKLKYSQKICHIASWFNIKQNYIQRIKGKYSDALKYLIHENAPEKYQYPVEEVKYSDGFDWIKEKNKGFSSRFAEIMNLIDKGVIKEFNETDHMTIIESVKYSSQIKKAYEYRRKKVLSSGGKDMNVLFITGDPGVGKTTYAKNMAKEQNLSCFVAGSSRDPFDNYSGQECVILDDLRPNEHHISDLLKMLDNHTASSVGSRYYDKVIKEVKYMIITSVQDIVSFYKEALYSEPDLAVQLCRRVYATMKMTKELIIISEYNPEVNRYVEVSRMPNVTKTVFASNAEGQKRKIEALEGIIKGVNQGMLNLAKGLEASSEKKEETKSQQPPKKARGSRSKNKCSKVVK